MRELNAVVSEFSTKRISIAASLGSVRNMGVDIPAIEVSIFDSDTQRPFVLIFRDKPNTFRDFLRREIDRIKNTPVPDKKIIKSL